MSDPSQPGGVYSGTKVFWRNPAWWRRTGRAYLAVIAATALAFAGSIIAARALGPALWGQAVLALSVVELVGMFLDLTLEEAVVHYGAGALARHDVRQLRGLLRAAILIDLAVGLAVFVLIIAAAAPIAHLLGRDILNPNLVRLAALGGLAVTADGTSGAVLLIAGKPDLRAFAMAWTNLLRLGALAVAVRLGGPAWVVGGMAIAYAVGGLSLFALAWHVAWRDWSKREGGGSVRFWAARLVRFGVHSSLTTSAIAARKALVVVFLGRLAGTRAIGLFDVAFLPVTVAMTGTAPIRLSLLPAQAELWARGEQARLRDSVVAYSKAAIFLGGPGAVIGWVLLPWLLPALYSEGFINAIPAARILLIAALSYFVVGWAKTLPAAIGQPQVRTLVALFELVLIAVSMLYLGRYGALGAAVAVSTSASGVALVWWALFGRILRSASASRQDPTPDDKLTPGPADREEGS